MYFMTYGGLSVYDGVQFKNYRQEDGLANELVNDVVEITPDSFLIASNAPLLNTLVRGKIGLYKTSDNFYPVTNRFLKSNDGFLYVIADDGLFKLFDHKFIKLQLLDAQGIDIGRNMDRITEWNQYFLIIPWNFLQKEKLIIYDKEKKAVVGSITGMQITSTAVSPEGDLWVSTPDGIEVMDPASLQKGKIKLHPLPFEGNGVPWKNAHIYFDHRGDTWVYLNNEILYLTASGKKQIISSEQGLKTSNLSDLLVDHEGIIWMASDGNGVVKMPGMNVQILSDLVPGVRNNISYIYQKSDTTWLFNTTDNSFYRLHDGKLSSYKLGKYLFRVNNIYIRGDELYFTGDHKIFLIPHKNLPSSYSHPFRIFPDTSPILEIGYGLVDPNGVIIQTIRQDDSTFYLAVINHHQVEMKYMLSFAVDQLAIDKDEHLWVAIRDNSLKAYSLHPESPLDYLQVINDYSKETEGISPRSITTNKEGNVWIGTRYNGLYRFQLEGNKFQSSLQFTTLNGLTDNFIYHLYCDPDNNIWAGSQTGLDKISLKDGEYIIENITKSKNIFQGIYKIINVANDVIWALTSNGDIIRVSSGVSNRIAPTPSLFITSLSVNDKEYDETTTVFPHDLNNITIGVAAPSFLDEKSIQYSYRLQGSGKSNWSEPANIANFNFINLAPGNYTLHVKAAFPASMYPTQQLKYAFTIRPPFWQTWWFLFLAYLILFGLLGWIVSFYYNRKLEKQRIILEKKRAIEKERTRIATDMHDDLGAGLLRIKFLSEMIGIRKQQHQPIEEEITNIRRYAHEMIDKMGEIVWALNEKNDSLSDLLSYTRAYAVEYLAENGLQGKIDKLPPLKTMMVNGEFRRNIYLSVKEALHNVIKHARASWVSVHFKVNDKLVIAIQDDGVGFERENTLDDGNGLSNMKKRMSEIGGDLEIIQDHGTCIVLTAPLPS